MKNEGNLGDRNKRQTDWFYILRMSLTAMLVGIFLTQHCHAATEAKPDAYAHAVKDIDFVLTQIKRGAVEGWNFTAPIKKHGDVGLAILTRMAKYPTPDRDAIFLLGHLKVHTPEVLLALTCALFHSDKKVRGQAIVALRNIGGKAKDCLPILEKLLSDPQWSTKEAKYMRPELELAVSRMRKAQKDERKDDE